MPTITQSALKGAAKAAKDKKNRQQLEETYRNIPEIRLSEIGVVGKTPIELDLEIQSERALHVLDTTIRKFQIVAMLPGLIENNGEQLKKYLTDAEVDFILEACAAYDLECSASKMPCLREPSRIATMIDKINMYTKKRESHEDRERIRKFSDASHHHHSRSRSTQIHRQQSTNSRDSQWDKISKKSAVSAVATSGRKSDPRLSQVIDILYNNIEFRKEAFKFDLANEPCVNNVIEGILTLKHAAIERLSTTAAEEREREKRLKTAWKENLDAKEEIEVLTQQLEKQREELGDQVLIKEAQMHKYEQQTDAVRQEFRENVKKIIQESEKQMVLETEASTIRKVELTEEAERVESQYKATLEDHLASEKALRAKRFKVETQLASWLTKYDTDIGERHAEFEELTRCYNKELEETDALQEKFDEQEEEYTVLMAEKEELEREIFAIKAYQFLINRNARRIQRCWRRYRERKAARKQKPKKGGKGKGSKGSGGKKRSAPKKKEVHLVKQADPNAVLQSAFKGELLEDIKNDDFGKKDIVVDLSEPKGVTNVTT